MTPMPLRHSSRAFYWWSFLIAPVKGTYDEDIDSDTQKQQYKEEKYQPG